MHQIPELSVSVRGLAEAVHRKGGLAVPLYGGISGSEGTAAHRRFAEMLSERDLPDSPVIEARLSGHFSDDDYSLSVGGRADAYYRAEDGLHVIEVKSFRGDPSRLPPQGDSTHWAQAYLYAHLILEKTNDEAVIVELAYISIENDNVVTKTRKKTRVFVSDFFTSTCRSFLSYTKSLARYLAARNEANRGASFPYASLREGQRELMRLVCNEILAPSILLASAPTGIGKTVATLYPALKTQAGGHTERIFYLTHVTSTRDIAEDTLDDLRKQGFLVRAITLYAKEKLCLYPDLYCDERKCPAAVDYYDRQLKALEELFPLQQIEPGVLLPVAKSHCVCPFELSLDVSRWCDVIICDYNYVFDPRVRLTRYFDDVSEKITLLVDEAHNLPARARSMYSATLELEQFVSAARLLVSRELGPDTLGDPLLVRIVNRAAAELERTYMMLSELFPALNGTGDKGFALLDETISSADEVQAENFLGSRRLPASLLPGLSRLDTALTDVTDTFRDWESRNDLLMLRFDIAFFLRIGLCYFNDTYVLSLRRNVKNEHFLSLICLDATIPLYESIDKTVARVFFSATLSPIGYYEKLLGPQGGLKPVRLILPSPFPQQKRLVLASDAASLLYKNRAASLKTVHDLIEAATAERQGNYLVFMPSFSYLNELKKLFDEDKKDDTASGFRTELMFQTQGMSVRRRRAFLERFQTGSKNSLIAFSVIGSLFNEGIDLRGDRLIGVIIVGTGLPGLSPIRDLMGQYFQERLGDGFKFAYMYPGFNRVMQAAGRLIRTEMDTGFILLIDDRYKREDYRALLPEDWSTRFVGGPADVAAHIAEFWRRL